MKLLLLGAGVEQKIIIDHAHDLGIFVIAVDENPNAFSLKFADKYVVSDIKNVDKMWTNRKERHGNYRRLEFTQRRKLKR